jgi:hypothetical protein
MLKVTDCGCCEHESCQATFTGNKALMIERLIANLQMYGEYYTYICEYGHTHRVMSNFPRHKITITHLIERGLNKEMIINNIA